MASFSKHRDTKKACWDFQASSRKPKGWPALPGRPSSPAQKKKARKDHLLGGLEKFLCQTDHACCAGTRPLYWFSKGSLPRGAVLCRVTAQSNFYLGLLHGCFYPFWSSLIWHHLWLSSSAWSPSGISCCTCHQVMWWLTSHFCICHSKIPCHLYWKIKWRLRAQQGCKSLYWADKTKASEGKSTLWIM